MANNQKNLIFTIILKPSFLKLFIQFLVIIKDIFCKEVILFQKSKPIACCSTTLRNGIYRNATLKSLANQFQTLLQKCCFTEIDFLLKFMLVLIPSLPPKNCSNRIRYLVNFQIQTKSDLCVNYSPTVSLIYAHLKTNRKSTYSYSTLFLSVFKIHLSFFHKFPHESLILSRIWSNRNCYESGSIHTCYRHR